MTLHLRQTATTAAEIERLIDDALVIEPRPAAYRNGMKRWLDVSLVLLAAVPTLFLTLIFGLLVALDGRNPFYVQQRVGRNGQIFKMWKLRSMVPNADKLLESYLAENPAARAEWDRDQKLRSDPRITRVGKLIRKTSVDELPQLWNVLRGDMSLVGPRPMMPSQQDMYPGVAYYALRPGITGFWQISVRNESSFSERAEFDTAYLREMSFATDLRVLKDTVGVVLGGTGH